MFATALFTTLLLEHCGQDPFILKDAARHANVRTTMGYVHTKKERVKAAVDKLDLGLPDNLSSGIGLNKPSVLWASLRYQPGFPSFRFLL